MSTMREEAALEFTTLKRVSLAMPSLGGEGGHSGYKVKCLEHNGIGAGGSSVWSSVTGASLCVGSICAAGVSPYNGRLSVCWEHLCNGIICAVEASLCDGSLSVCGEHLCNGSICAVGSSPYDGSPLCCGSIWAVGAFPVRWLQCCWFPIRPTVVWGDLGHCSWKWAWLIHLMTALGARNILQ